MEAELNMTLLVVHRAPPHPSPCYVSFVPGTHNKHKLHFGSQARLGRAGTPAEKHRLWQKEKKNIFFILLPCIYCSCSPIPHLAPWCLVSLPRLSNQRQTGLRAGRSPFIESSQQPLLFLFCFFFLPDEAPLSSSKRAATCPSVTTDHTASRHRRTAFRTIPPSPAYLSILEPRQQVVLKQGRKKKLR